MHFWRLPPWSEASLSFRLRMTVLLNVQRLEVYQPQFTIYVLFIGQIMRSVTSAVLGICSRYTTVRATSAG